MYFFLLLMIIALAALAMGASKLGRERVQWYANNVLIRLGGIWFGFCPPKTILPPEVPNQPKTLPSSSYIAFDRLIRFIKYLLEKPHSLLDLDKVRQAFNSFAFGLEKDIQCEIRNITRWEDEKEQIFTIQIYTPPGDYISSRLIFFAHGGGLYAGDGLGTHRHALGELARLTHTRVLAVDYRIIPEASYDTPIKDTLRAWDYATNKEWGMGIEPHNIIVAGESAGGTLVSLLVTYLQRRTQYKDETHLPCAVMLISIYDFSANESPSRQFNGIPYPKSFVSDPLVSTRMLKWNTSLLSQCGAPDDTGRFYSSLYQATIDVQQYNLSKPYQGFPSTMIICGQYETLIDDSQNILKAMQDAGVDVKYSFPDWYIHMQFNFTGLYPEATASLQEMADYINTQFTK